MTFNLIKVRVIHPIQGIYVSCCKTSLHWAGKLRNERKHACTDFVAKRRTNFRNNYSQLTTTCSFLARFEWWVVRRATQYPYSLTRFAAMQQNKFLLPILQCLIVIRTTIWNVVMTFCFHDIFRYYGAWEFNCWWNLKDVMWPIQEKW